MRWEWEALKLQSMSLILFSTSVIAQLIDSSIGAKPVRSFTTRWALLSDIEWEFDRNGDAKKMIVDRILGIFKEIEEDEEVDKF